MLDIQDRTEIINEIINVGSHNPDLNVYYLAILFVELSAEIMVFERVGVDLIQPKIQAMINNDTQLKPILLSYIDPITQTTTVQDAIAGYLNV